MLQFCMWSVMEEQVYAYVLFFFGLIGLIIYFFTAFALMVSLFSGRLCLYQQTNPLLEHDELPGVSVIKPLMGVDPLLEENIESHFKICYPQLELLFCVQDDQDPAIGLVKRLQEKYPKVDSHLFIGDKNEIVNPLVKNMSPAYAAAKYGYIWISTSRIKGLKAALDEAKGLSWYGRYLAEDYYLGRAIRDRGYSLVISAFPAQQNVGLLSMANYKDRMVRWLRLRFSMIPFVTIIIEPLTECLPLGLYGSWSIHHFLGVNPYYIFSFHILGWLIIDYLQLKNIQRTGLAFSKLTFVMAWLCRELMTLVIVIEAFLKPQHIQWGKKTYRVDFNGHTHLVQNNRPTLNV
ncbi:ceramide glucosyltransferase 2 [Octopus bimaculoides]|nr:ceramide glucosyltransferase 2 [Octopus bimaculoides]|eukprot:XP_014779295.1 PREDICTED: ceramide glucosyltransferase 2-like [Octopus bimaculoides]